MAHGHPCIAKENFDIEVVTYPFSVKKVAEFQPAFPTAQATMMTSHAAPEISQASRTLRCSKN